jgi:hypothetical protein
MDEWIPLVEEKPGPNRFIRLKGFNRSRPYEELISPTVYVDGDGLFASSQDVQDTHWKYVPV